MLDEFGDVLGAIAGADEDGVGRFDDDEVFDADGRDEFRGTPEEISEGVKFSRAQVLTYAQFVQKRPQEGWFRITGGRLDAGNALHLTGET